ncbi:MAG: hypothetical protein ACRYFU_16000 [Janthinobacterium lividum]
MNEVLAKDAGGAGEISGIAAHDAAPPSSASAQEEARLLRRLQMMMNMVMGVIAQDNTLSYDDAATMVADARTAALAMFPGKELAYDLIWRPRFQRLMRERFRLV